MFPVFRMGARLTADDLDLDLNSDKTVEKDSSSRLLVIASCIMVIRAVFLRYWP